MAKRQGKNQGGEICLAEIIVVLVIIGILGACAIPGFQKARKKAEEKQAAAEALETKQNEKRLASQKARVQRQQLTREISARQEANRPQIELITVSDSGIHVFYDWARKIYLYRDLTNKCITTVSAPPPPPLPVVLPVENSGL
jgi:Tfp pilus assembly protein PilE